MISEHLTNWHGYQVHPLTFDSFDEPIPDLSRTVCRLFTDWEAKGPFPELFARFLELPGVEKTPGLIIGAFHGDDSSQDSNEVVELLVNAHSRLAGLRSIFIGDIISEENEVSWINHGDVSPVISAYPALEHLWIRGSNGLSLGTNQHERLRELVVQTGGLPRSVLADIAGSSFPNLEHLELWLGTDNYGWDGTVEDVRRVLEPVRFPKLRYLGLRNSEIQDAIAAFVVATPIVKQLEVLDLSLGTLTDAGAGALLANRDLARLKKLDLHHHFVTPALETKLKAAFPNVDLSSRQDADEYDGEIYRSISVSE